MKEDIFGDIVLDREEAYDPQVLDCWAFSKRGVVKQGVELLLGNMLNGFPIVIESRTYPCSEFLYLCGQFSHNTPEHAKVREDLLSVGGGFGAKKMIKARNKHLIREDFNQFRTQWMLWVVWQKTVQNISFQELLLKIPGSGVIIEDSSMHNGQTASIWGCKNDILNGLREARAKEIGAQYKDIMKDAPLKKLKNEEKMKIVDKGIFTGQNNMGKILMMCKRALEHDTVPPIDCDLLRGSAIYLSNDAPLQFAE